MQCRGENEKSNVKQKKSGESALSEDHRNRSMQKINVICFASFEVRRLSSAPLRQFYIVYYIGYSTYLEAPGVFVKQEVMENAFPPCPACIYRCALL